VRHIRLLVLSVIAALVVAAGAQAPAVRATASNGRIAFMRWDIAVGDQFVYTANPDGTHEERVTPYPAERPHWSPDGRELLFLCCDAAAKILTLGTGDIRTITPPPGLFLGCLAWTADGERLLCEGYGETDPALNGIYSVRASDGGGRRLVKATPNSDGIPQDASPDGSKLVFLSESDSDSLFVVGVDGNGLRRLDTGGLLDVSSASWSPDGEWIVFPAREAAGGRRSLFLIHPDGSSLHEVVVNPSCGGIAADRNSRGCLDPTWSPDGSKILFAILLAYNSQKQLYTIDPDGSHLTKVTRHGLVRGDTGEGEQAPDWGIHPLE